MQDHKEHITFSAADIRRYVKGELSAPEMHAIEKAALDDPFLADAIEGMQQAMQEHDDNLISGQLQQLHNEFQARTATSTQTATVIKFRWWQMAAAAVIVIAGAWWIYSNSSAGADNTTTVAQQKAKQPETETAFSHTAPAPSITPEQQAAAVDSTVAATVPQKPSTTSRAVTQKSPGNDALINKPVEAVASAPAIEPGDTAKLVAAANNRMDIEAVPKATIDERKNEAINDALAARRKVVQIQPVAREKQQYDLSNRETELITISKNDNRTRSVADNNKNLAGFVKGRVTDPFNNPVANANISMPNNNNRYNILTDKTGNFQIPASHDSVLNVSVNVVGYGTQNFRLQNNASLNELQLQPANVNLEEVVVTSIKSSKKAKPNTPTVMTQDAEPVFGWVAYEQYLQKNKKAPADYPAVNGNVVISFLVNKKGELSDFRIEQSLAKPHDDEAIRLITQGPAWKLIRGRKARITVIVRF